jgi:hypothetical protein
VAGLPDLGLLVMTPVLNLIRDCQITQGATENSIAEAAPDSSISAGCQQIIRCCHKQPFVVAE